MDLDVIKDANSPFLAALNESLRGVQESFLRPFWRLDISSIPQRKTLSKATKVLRDYGRKLIHDRQEAVSRGEDTPSDILDHILRVAKAEPTLTLEYLVDEFVTFFLAGHLFFVSFDFDSFKSDIVVAKAMQISLQFTLGQFHLKTRRIYAA